MPSTHISKGVILRFRAYKDGDTITWERSPRYYEGSLEKELDSDL